MVNVFVLVCSIYNTSETKHVKILQLLQRFLWISQKQNMLPYPFNVFESNCNLNLIE